MKKSFPEKKPILASVFWSLFVLLFNILGGVISSVTKADDVKSMIITGICLIAAILISLLYIKNSNYAFADYGFLKPDRNSIKRVLYFIPALLIEAISFPAGLREISIQYVAAALLFTLSVGIIEELVFRGILIQILKINGIRYAIMISAVLFGITHLGNLAGGAGLALTILQVVFAFTVGMVFAELFVITKSLLPVILWHFLHDFLGFIQTDAADMPLDTTLFYVAAQCIIFIIYGIYLWRKINDIK